MTIAGRVAWNWIVLLALVTAAVASGSCREVNAAVTDLAQSVRLPLLDLASSLVSLAGQAEVTIGIALGLAVARARRYPRSALIPLFIFVALAIEVALKILVPEPLPPHERSRTIEVVNFAHVPFAHPYPSGHVARLAFLLRIADPIPTWLVAAGILLMAVTRIYLGEHWLFDTVGGAILGLGVANVARTLR